MGQLIISPEDLADIRAQCLRRVAEFEATRSAAAQAIALPTSATSAPTSERAVVGPQEQAQRFAAAVQEMPARIRAFFECEDPGSARAWESDEERAQRERLTALGGWTGG